MVSLGLLLLWHKCLKAEGKVYFTPGFHNNSPLSKALREGAQAGLEPRHRSRYRDHKGVLLTGLLQRACPACFLIEPRTTTSPGMVPTHNELEPPVSITN